MIWCRFQAEGRTSYGIVEDGNVTEVTGTPFGDYAPTSNTRPLGAVKLLVPSTPLSFYTATVNYRDHVIEMARSRGAEPIFPTMPNIGYFTNNALTAHDEPIVIPRDASEDVHYGGEIVAVIGKVAKKVSRQEALGYVLGFTIGNDITERTWQSNDRTIWRSKRPIPSSPWGPGL